MKRTGHWRAYDVGLRVRTHVCSWRGMRGDDWIQLQQAHTHTFTLKLSPTTLPQMTKARPRTDQGKKTNWCMYYKWFFYKYKDEYIKRQTLPCGRHREALKVGICMHPCYTDRVHPCGTDRVHTGMGPWSQEPYERSLFFFSVGNHFLVHRLCKFTASPSNNCVATDSQDRLRKIWITEAPHPDPSQLI